MNALSVFEYETQAVRMVLRDEEPWWVLSDVCTALEITNSRNAAARLDDDEKGVHSMDTLGGRQELTLVNQSGLYNLIFSSRKEEAKRFRKWVTSVVLPSIRKTGSYSARPAPVAEPATTLLERLADPEARAALETTMRLVEFSKDLTPEQRVLAARVGLPIEAHYELPTTNPIEVEAMAVLGAAGGEMGYHALKVAVRKKYQRSPNSIRAALMDLVRANKVALRKYRNQELFSLVIRELS